MNIECDIAAKIVEKKEKQAEVDRLNLDIKELWYAQENPKSFAVTYKGYAVTVKKPSEYGISAGPNTYKPPLHRRPMPINTVVPLVEHCEVDD